MVLALHCYCEDNVKCGLYSKHLFDKPKYEFSLKNSSLKCWLCFRLNLGRKNNNSRYDFAAPLKYNILTYLTRLIAFFILMLLHTVSIIGMYCLLCMLTYAL